MKNIRFFAVFGLILLLGCVARAANYIRPAAVTVVAIQGEARYSTDGKEWHPLVVGKILRAGAVIETAANSTCDLVLSGTPVPTAQSTASPQSMAMLAMAPDPNIRGFTAFKPMAQQNVIRMDADTMLAVDKLTVIDTGTDSISDTELDLRAGKIFTSVKKLSANSQYIVKIPNGVAGIRGFAGSITAKGTVLSLFGTVVLSFIGPNGVPNLIVIHGGHGYDVTTGQDVILSPEVIHFLKNLNNTFETVYVTYSTKGDDLTLQFLSPTQGAIVNSGSGGSSGGSSGGGV